MLAGEGTLEEALCCLLVPLGTEQEVDRLASAVDRSVQVAPLPADPDVRLVNVPRPAARTQVAAHPFFEFRGEALNPAVHGRVIHRDAPVGEHGLEIAIADRELQVPAYGPEDRLGRKAEAAECPGGVGHDGTLGRMLAGTPLLPGHAAPLNATDPFFLFGRFHCPLYLVCRLVARAS